MVEGYSVYSACSCVFFDFLLIGCGLAASSGKLTSISSKVQTFVQCIDIDNFGYAL
jgi:hypothetical protein